MSVLSHPRFHNEDAAFAWVESILWPDGPTCPHCGAVDRISAIKPNKAKKVRIGLKFCGHCRKQFTVRVGTIFEDSHLPMTKWLQAIHLMVSSKKGVSSHQLMRTLETTYKTAWFLSHRIREAMKDYHPTPMGGSGKVVEADETFLGLQGSMFVNGEGWTRRSGTSDLRKVLTLVERGGRARSIKVEHLRKDEIARALATADRSSVLMTDEARHYGVIGRQFAGHVTVNHSQDEYVRGAAYTNTVEGFFSIFKRGMKGVYQHCGEKHLHRYLAEFDFRYNNRVALGVDDQERATRALTGVVGKRLSYRPSGGWKEASKNGETARA